MTDVELAGEHWLRASRAAESTAKGFDLGLLAIEVGITALLIVAGVVTRGTGGALAIVSGIALVGHQVLSAGAATWTGRSAIYRGNYERTVLGTDRSLLETEGWDQAAGLSERDRAGNPEDPTSSWFAVTDPSRPEMIIAIRESLLFGALLRLRWLGFIGSVAIAVSGAATWYSIRVWPLTGWKMLVLVIALLLLASIGQRATSLVEYVRLRDGLERGLRSIGDVAEPGRELAFLVLHERLCQARRHRPLVPTWFYEWNRKSIDRRTASRLAGEAHR